MEKEMDSIKKFKQLAAKFEKINNTVKEVVPFGQ